MTRSSRWLIGTAFAVIAVVAIGVTVYAFRDRLARLPGMSRLAARSEGHDAMQMPAPTPVPQAGAAATPAEPPRGDVQIDLQRQQLIGVRLAPVERTSLSAPLRTTGVVRYDETRLTDINVKLDGWIRELYVDYTGQLVTKGQRLFAFYSPDLLTAENELLLALKSRDQMQTSQVGDARDYANRILEAARQRLALWDIPADQIATMETTRQALTTVTFPSPATGYVVEKQALQGMHVTPGQMLYKLADLSNVWVEADVYEQEMSSMRVGQRATVTLDAYPGESFDGRAIYIYPFVEENSRTLKVRFQFPNPRGRLRPGMFANVQLHSTGGTALTVPANAVLDSGVQKTVFVAQGDGVFTPRTVEVGRQLGDRIQILGGVKEGEQVATSATFFLDSESQLRAGLQNYETPASAGAAPATAGPALDIAFRPQPDPPKTGDSTFEVTVKDPMKGPVTDAEVLVTLFMPAMPTMNMPAMRNETKLPHAGNGVYRGPGQVMMAGRWDATVTVTRGGQRVGSKQFAVVAR
jgi:membrane fusion protein, copper/silver efflux system